MEYWRRRRINRKQHIWMVSIFGLDDRGCFLCFSLFLVLQQQQTWTGLINSCRSLNGCSHPFLVTLLPFIIQLQHFSWFQQLFFKRLLNLMPPSPNEITSAIAIGLCQTLTNGTYRVSGHVPSPKLPHSVQCAMQLLQCGNVTMARIKYCFNKNLA